MRTREIVRSARNLVWQSGLPSPPAKVWERLVALSALIMAACLMLHTFVPALDDFAPAYEGDKGIFPMKYAYVKDMGGELADSLGTNRSRLESNFVPSSSVPT